MQLGILNTSLTENSLQQAFEQAAKAGAQGVEVMYGTPAQAQALGRPDHAAELKDLAAGNDLAIPSLCLGWLCQKPSLIGTPQAVEEAQEYVRRALATAAGVGAGVVLVPFFGKNAIELEDELNRASEALMGLVEPAEESGVVIGVESNLNFSQQEFLMNYLGNSPGVKIYYDTGNLLSRKLDVPTGIRQLGRDRIAQVHVKDVRIAEWAPPDFNVALGEGNVDLRACVEALKAIGYAGWLILETPGGADPLASAKANIAHLRALLRP